MITRMVVMLLVVGALAGGIYEFKGFVSGKIKESLAGLANQPQTVSATEANVEDWQPHLQAVGSVRAVNGADLSAQVGGIVSAIHFESGSDVTKGTLLVELQASDDIAKLQSLQASEALARVTYTRDLQQLKAQAVSQQTVDNDAQNLKSLEAQVAQQQAIVDYKFIRAPFDGQLGIRQVDLGQYLSAGTSIATLQALDPIYVDFYLPQQALAEIKTGQPLTVHVDTFPNENFAGNLKAINSKVDPTTRNVQVRAEVRNPEHKLLPGMFATVEIDTGALQHLVTLPITTIAYNAFGDTVYVVEDKGSGPDGKPLKVARQTFVKTGATRGDQVAILSGVNAGEIVVTAGQNKLHNGSPIAINNTVQPTADARPTPSDE
jgi:membrane fusion protein, multidrug efflux system